MNIRCGDKLKEVDVINTFELLGFNFFVHKESVFEEYEYDDEDEELFYYIVSEQRSGFRVCWDYFENSAIETAKELITKAGKEKMNKKIKNAIKECGEANNNDKVAQ